MHHSRWQYVGPATMSRILQPDKKTGRQASEASMLVCSMQALSCVATRRHAHKGSPRVGTEHHVGRRRERTSHRVGSSPYVSSCRRAHRLKHSYFAPGASSSSRQL